MADAPIGADALDQDEFDALRYRNLVRQAIRNADGKPVFNGSCEHASILMSEMFTAADKQMRILSEKLLPECYNSDAVRSAFTDFLDRGGNVRIVVEDDSGLDTHPLADLFERDRVQIVRLAEIIRSQVTYHMAIMDGVGYRFESDKTKMEAIAAFGDEDRTEHLSKIFDKIWGLSSDTAH
jgi:hypothetical protein